MKRPKLQRQRRPRASALAAAPEEQAFAEVLEMIQGSRSRALAAVNTALIDLYWRVGEYISRKLETAAWGEGVVEALARYIQRHHPNLRGFTRPNLFRMRQLFEAYQGDEKVSPLVRQLPRRAAGRPMPDRDVRPQEIRHNNPKRFKEKAMRNAQTFAKKITEWELINTNIKPHLQEMPYLSRRSTS